jgi:hypothetical protein
MLTWLFNLCLRSINWYRHDRIDDWQFESNFVAEVSYLINDLIDVHARMILEILDCSTSDFQVVLDWT